MWDLGNGWMSVALQLWQEDIFGGNNASGHIIEEMDRLRGLVTDLDWLAETDHGELRLTLEEGSVYELLTAEVIRQASKSDPG